MQRAHNLLGKPAVPQWDNGIAKNVTLDLLDYIK